MSGYLYDEWKEVYGISRKDELMFVFFELTRMCNLHCDHCASECGDADGAELTTEQWKDFADYLARAFIKEWITVYITGGEPMLRPDFYEIVEHINKCGLRWGMTTNGTLISEEDVKRLAKAGMRTVSVSVDGLEEYHDSFRNAVGSYKAALRALELMIPCSRFERVQATTVVTKENFEQLPALYEIFKNMGLKEWRITGVDPSGRAKDKDWLLDADGYTALFEYIEKLRKEGKISVQYGCSHFVPPIVSNDFRANTYDHFVPESFKYDVRDHAFVCGAGNFVASVLSNGDIFSCLNIERRPELIQGNIQKDDFLTVWENGFEAFRGDYRVAKSDKCCECGNRDLCKGDSAHTWDYDKNEPRVCLYNMLKEQRFKESGVCGKCGGELLNDALYCHRCGAKRGEGDYDIYDFDPRKMQLLYGPLPRRFSFTCKKCGRKWGDFLRVSPRTQYCPECGCGIENIDIVDPGRYGR